MPAQDGTREALAHSPATRMAEELPNRKRGSSSCLAITSGTARSTGYTLAAGNPQGRISRSRMFALGQVQTALSCSASQTTLEPMTTRPIVLLAAAITLMSMQPAAACSFDTDCAVGSRCLKQQGALYGVCAGGLHPGNSNDLAPVEDPLDMNRTYGDTCAFDTDCGPGSVCFKEGPSFDGVCLQSGRDRSVFPQPETQERQECRSSYDCRRGEICLKSGARRRGVCVE